MTPPAQAAARRAPARSVPRRDDRATTPGLRIVQPLRRRRRTPRIPALAVAGGMVVASLLAVVVADGLQTTGQLRLSALQGQVAAATVQRANLQSAVAEQSAPGAVVQLAESKLGMVPPAQITDLPQVSLDVPLAPPDTSPPAAAAAPAAPATPATPPASPTTPSQASPTR